MSNVADAKFIETGDLEDLVMTRIQAGKLKHAAFETAAVSEIHTSSTETSIPVPEFDSVLTATMQVGTVFILLLASVSEEYEDGRVQKRDKNANEDG